MLLACAGCVHIIFSALARIMDVVCGSTGSVRADGVAQEERGVSQSGGARGAICNAR